MSEWSRMCPSFLWEEAMDIPVSRRLSHRFGFSVDGDDGTSVIHGFWAEERLSEPFRVEVELASKVRAVDFDRFLEREAVLSIADERMGEVAQRDRYFCWPLSPLDTRSDAQAVVRYGAGLCVEENSRAGIYSRARLPPLHPGESEREELTLSEMKGVAAPWRRGEPPQAQEERDREHQLFQYPGR